MSSYAFVMGTTDKDMTKTLHHEITHTLGVPAEGDAQFFADTTAAGTWEQKGQQDPTRVAQLCTVMVNDGIQQGLWSH